MQYDKILKSVVLHVMKSMRYVDRRGDHGGEEDTSEKGGRPERRRCGKDAEQRIKTHVQMLQRSSVLQMLTYKRRHVLD